MGAIHSINSKPKTWPVQDQGAKLKPEYGGEPLVQVTYGSTDDYPEGTRPDKMFMRKSVYEKCLSGEYRVDPSSQNELKIVDSSGKPVQPIAPDMEIY